MKWENKRWRHCLGGNKEYAKNWDRIFGKKEDKKNRETENQTIKEEENDAIEPGEVGAQPSSVDHKET